MDLGERLSDWDKEIALHLASGGRPRGRAELADFGADAGIPDPPNVGISPHLAEASQSFVKFLGEGTNRASLSWSTLDEVKRAGCHWTVAYPEVGNRRPSGVQDGAVMFTGRLVKGPDIGVFGRAIAVKHQPGRDEATRAEIKRRPWKSRWPLYIRVHDAEFVSGTMANGVSLSDLMEDLNPHSRHKRRFSVSRRISLS